MSEHWKETDGEFEARWAKLDIKVEKIWDKRRKGKISYNEAQRQLDDILPMKRVNPKGWIAKLDNELQQQAFYLMPQKVSPQVNFRKLKEMREKIIKSTNWLEFWTHCKWLAPPTQLDLAEIQVSYSSLLSECLTVCSNALRQFIDSFLEGSKTCIIIYEFYKLLKAEAERRGMLPEGSRDGYQEYLSNRTQYRESQNLLEKARQTGSICPYCKSTNVGSYNKEQWYCRDCKANREETKDKSKSYRWRKR